MTLRRALLACVFGSMFLIGLGLFAPASLMGYLLEHASGGTLSLAQTSGSVWQGSGVVLLRQHTRYQSLGSYLWHLRLFSASLQVQTGAARPMTVRYAPFSGSFAIDDLHLTLPASTLELAASQFGPYQLQGMLAVDCAHLTLDAAGIDGQINVDWSGAASGLSEIRPLGDYRILLQGNGGGLKGQLSTLSGKLLLAGNGSFDKTNGIRINGTAQAAPGLASTELNELLHHIGPEIRPGVFTLTLMSQAAVTH